MDIFTIALVVLVVWLSSALEVSFWAAYRDDYIDAESIGVYTLLGPVCFLLILSSYARHLVWPFLKKLLRKVNVLKV
jgi:hypothetical protein